MNRTIALLPLLLLATAAPAQQVSPQERARLQRLGAALAQCHGGIVRRDAPTRATAAQIVQRALAGCAAREAPIRAALVRHMGAERAAQAMQAQRAHWRAGIAQMVAAARARR
ncbi:MAG TPA: hypothetical protein VGW40_15510 [Allosphingosinicella sp.]|nr:hypothetical protein [Allosphingosinicella sp.]